MKLSQIGEFGLIDLLTGDLSAGPGVICGVGDDTAVIDVSRDKWLLFTTDMMVEGVHFSFDYSTPEQVGWKLLAVNVSDIAAMGGQPTQAVVSMAIPDHIDVALMEALYKGLKEAAAEYRVSLVGGDTVGGKERLVLNLALLGEVTAGQAVYRQGAKPGDLVFVTGALGASAAGLYVFQHPETPCSREAADYCRLAHAKPRPNVTAGMLLAGLGVTSMNDISDGLANEIHEICEAGKVGCLLKETDIPVDLRVSAVAALAVAEQPPGGGSQVSSDTLVAASVGDGTPTLRMDGDGILNMGIAGDGTSTNGTQVAAPVGDGTPTLRTNGTSAHCAQAWHWALYGGEDFCLVFTVSPENCDQVCRVAADYGLDLYPVGVIREGGGVEMEKSDGTLIPLPRGGYDHFKNTR